MDRSDRNEILSDARIVEVWTALGGPTLHGGPYAYRGCAWWRNGDGLNVSVNAVRNVWFDHRNGLGGGIVDLIARVRGVRPREALCWLAEWQGVGLQRLSREDRTRHREERRKLEKLLASALLFQRAVIALFEELLADLKGGLFDSGSEPTTARYVFSLESDLRFFRQLAMLPLVEKYIEWCSNNREFTEALVRAAASLEEAETNALKNLLLNSDSEGPE